VMVKFLLSRKFDELVNVETICTIHATNDVRHSSAVTKDDLTVELLDNIYEINHGLCPVIATAPGYTLLVYNGGENNFDDGTDWVTREPIVAWRIINDQAAPITPEDYSGLENLTTSILYAQFPSAPSRRS
jgi:hypothetical protein